MENSRNNLIIFLSSLLVVAQFSYFATHSRVDAIEEKDYQNVNVTVQNVLDGGRIWTWIEKIYKNLLGSLYLDRGTSNVVGKKALQNTFASNRSLVDSNNTSLTKVSACTCVTVECRECIQDPPDEESSCPGNCPYCGCQGDGSCDYSCDDEDDDNDDDNEENGANPVGVTQPVVENPPTCQPLTAPVNLRYNCNVRSNSVTLSWDSSPNATFYSLRFRSNQIPGDLSCGTTLPGSLLCLNEVGGVNYLVGPAQSPPYNITLDMSKEYSWWVHSRCGTSWTDSPVTNGPNVKCNISPTAQFMASALTPSCPSTTSTLNYDLFVTSITPSSNNMSSTYFMTFYSSGDPQNPWTNEWKQAVKNYLGPPDYAQDDNNFAYILGFSSASSGNAMGYRLTADTLIGGVRTGVTRKKLSDLIMYYSNPYGVKPFLIGANLRVNGVQTDYVGGKFFNLNASETSCAGLTPTPTVTGAQTLTPTTAISPPLNPACVYTSECSQGMVCTGGVCTHDGVGDVGDVCKISGPTPPPYKQCGNLLECIGQDENGEGICQIKVCEGAQIAGCAMPTATPLPTNTSTPTPTPLPVGAACIEKYQCAVGFVCKDDPNQPSIKTCQQGLTLNDVCTLEPDLCGNTYYCDPVTRRCSHKVCTPEAAYGCVTPTPAPSLKSMGDANADREINKLDFEIWRIEYLGIAGSDADGDGNVWDADFNIDSKVDLLDLWIWLANRR